MDFYSHRDFVKKMNPIISLERCDKIWNTLQLIKQIQYSNPSTGFDNFIVKPNKTNVKLKNGSGIQHFNNPIVEEDDHDGNAYNEDDDPDDYIDDTASSPDLEFFCNICGKSYKSNRSLRYHSISIHGIPLPPMKRGPKQYDKVDGNRNNLINDNDSFIKVNTINKNTRNNLPQESLSFVKFKESRSTPKRVNPFHKSNSYDDTSSTSSTRKDNQTNDYSECFLCKHSVKNLKAHFVEYHKIDCPLEMLNKFETPSNSDESIATNNEKIEKPGKATSFNSTNTRNTNESDNSSDEEFGESLFDDSNLSDDYLPNPKRKNLMYNKESGKRYKTFDAEPTTPKELWKISKSQMIVTERYECDICYGEYASSDGLVKHKRIHRKRGETKENFHLFECRYFKSPMFSGQSLNLKSVHDKNVQTNVNKRLDNIQEQAMKNSWEFSRKTSLDTESSINLQNDMQQDFERTCICGRSFRNPHTLFTHKNNCKMNDSKNDDIRRYASRDSPDKDSNAGINIRIKKKNDSYEIVSKDSGDDNESKNSETSEKYESCTDVGLLTSFNKSYRKRRNVQRANYKENSSSDEEFVDESYKIHCEICNEKIHILTKLEHEYYHFGMGFPCHLCKRAYRNKSFLAKHHRIVHGNIS